MASFDGYFTAHKPYNMENTNWENRHDLTPMYLPIHGLEYVFPQQMHEAYNHSTPFTNLPSPVSPAIFMNHEDGFNPHSPAASLQNSEEYSPISPAWPAVVHRNAPCFQHPQGDSPLGEDEEIPEAFNLLGINEPGLNMWDTPNNGPSLPPQTTINSSRSRRGGKNFKPVDRLSLSSSKLAERRHRRNKSSTDSVPDIEQSKSAHKIVERNYRGRLNNQIAELANLLFDQQPRGMDQSTPYGDSPSDTAGRPPKPLVISTACDRLRELTAQNVNLSSQVEQLKQRLAVLDHMIGGGSSSRRRVP